MKEQSLGYCAARNAAMDDLDRICQESERLKNRLYQLDEVAEALKSLIVLGEPAVVEVSRPETELIETAAEPLHGDRLTAQTVGAVLPQVAPQSLLQSADSVQRRFNSVLELAVA